MADEAVAPVVEATAEQANDVATGAEPGKQTEPAKTFTQAELDAIVTDRLQRAQRKAEEATKKATEAAQAQALKEQGEYQKLFEQAQAKLQEVEQRAKALELAGLRRKIADDLKFPVDFLDRVRGETEEEITADMRDFLAKLPKPAAPNINAGNGSGKGGAGVLSDEELEQKAARLGVSLKYAKQFLNGQGV
jgi:hypothetical protein